MKEVSCRMLAHWVEIVQRCGGSLDKMYARLPYSREYLANGANRIDWNEYVRFCEDGVRAAGGVEAVNRETILMSQSRGFSYLRWLAGWVATPYQLYDLVICRHGKHLYTHLDIKLLPLPDGRLELHIRIPEPYDDCPLWFEGSTTFFALLPEMIGLPPAKVTLQRRERYGIYTIDPPESNTLWHRIKRLGQTALVPLGIFQLADVQQAELVRLIEELQHERDSLNQLISGLPSGILILQEGRVAFANASLRQMFGLTDQKPFSLSALTPLDAAASPVGFRFAPQGQERLIELANRSTLTYQGRHADLLVLRDITAMQRVDDRIAQAATSEREKLAQDLHDGLGQYFAALNFKISLLLSTTPGETPLRATLGEIASLVREAGTLSREIVYGMNPSYADAGDLIASLRKLCVRMERLFPVAVSLRSSVASARTSAAVGSELLYLVREAMTNAARHAAPSRIDLQIEQAMNGWQIAIVDDGTGFDVAAVLQDGSGLGFEAMRLRAARLGGTLEVCSGTGGTEIRLHLPTGLLVPMEAPSPDAPAPASAASAASRRVFLMDDHAIVRNGVRRLIETDRSLSICGEADGPEGLSDALRRTGADTLISDWLIGERSSADTLREIRREHPEMRIIVLTMLEGEGYHRQALAAGADAFVHKGQAPDHLLQLLRSPSRPAPGAPAPESPAL